MNQRHTRTKSPQIKTEPAFDDESSKPKKPSTRTNKSHSSNSSNLDATRVTPAQLKNISKAKNVPKIISNIAIPFDRATNFLPASSQSCGSSSISSHENIEEITFQEQNSMSDSSANINMNDLLDVTDGDSQYIQGNDGIVMSNEKQDDLDGEQVENTISSNLDSDITEDPDVDMQRYLFTSSKVTDSLEENDASAEYTGYVDYVDVVKDIPEHGKLLRVVLNNNDESRMMLTAWNTNIKALLEVAEVGNVLDVQGLLVKQKQDTRNNLGSSDKYFETQAITSYEVLGKLKNLPIDCGLCKIDFDKLDNAQGLICINGVVKTAPRLQKSPIIGNRIVGGITNGTKVIEIVLPENQQVLHIKKGEPVKVIGALTRKSHGLHVIKVSSPEDIMRIPGEVITDLKYFVNAHVHV